MQTLYFDVAECPTGTLSGAERYRIDASSGKLFGVTFIAGNGVAVHEDPEDVESAVTGYNFNAGHTDSNCEISLSNAMQLFVMAAADLGSGETPDQDIVYSLVKPFIGGRTFSRMYLEIAIAGAGLLNALDAYLASFEVSPGYSAARAWDRANVIREEFPGFDSYFAAAKKALGITDAQAEAILEQGVVK